MKTTRNFLCAAVLVAPVISLPAFAQAPAALLKTYDRDRNGELSAAELGELLQARSAAPAAVPAKPAKPRAAVSPTVLENEWKAINTTKDGFITLDELEPLALGGRLVLPAGRKFKAVFDEADSDDLTNALSMEEFAAARKRDLFTMVEMTDEAFAKALKDAKEKLASEGVGKVKTYLSITASGLGDAKGKGPATVSWIRQREQTAAGGKNTSRWDVDAKAALKLNPMLGEGFEDKGLFPKLIASAEARIIDYNSREADEKAGALNHLRYKLAADWALPNYSRDTREVEQGGQGGEAPFFNGSIVSAEVQRETDPSADYRNTTGSIYWRPVLRPLHPEKLFGFIPFRSIYIDPRIGYSFGNYDKEVAESVSAVPGTKSVTKLGGGRERVSFEQTRNRVVTESDISQAVFNVVARVDLTDRLSLTGTYKLVLELSGDNRAFHYGNAGVNYNVGELYGAKTYLSANYTVGQDAPSFERDDILTLGLGVEF